MATRRALVGSEKHANGQDSSGSEDIDTVKPDEVEGLETEQPVNIVTMPPGASHRVPREVTDEQVTQCLQYLARTSDRPATCSCAKCFFLLTHAELVVRVV